LWIADYQITNALDLAWCICIILGALPLASATPDHDAFPNIPFTVFSQFIHSHFSSGISLATVLTLLFTLTENPDLLNLHARQQNPQFSGENKITISGWMKTLVRALEQKLGHDIVGLCHDSENRSNMSGDVVTTMIGTKLDAFSKLLNLYPYNKKGQFQGKLNLVSQKAIEPVYVICPASMECETMDCNPRSLVQATRDRDIPKVTLIKGTNIYTDVPVLTGRCPDCETKYFADHERALQTYASDAWSKVYLNSAKFLKVGTSVWVDCVFSKAVLNGIYSFHASSSAYAEFWNDSFWNTQSNSRKITRRQIWHIFVQESLHAVATGSNQTLVLKDSLKIVEVTKEAFGFLGSNGMIQSAHGHVCSECTHTFKETADIISGDDPAALVEIDENRTVPVLLGEGGDLAAQDAAEVRQLAVQARTHRGETNAMIVDNEAAPVVMAVVDGVVMGPKHCDYGDCTAELANACGGVFCTQHLAQYGSLCRI
jgi:hypothetical protein